MLAKATERLRGYLRDVCKNLRVRTEHSKNRPFLLGQGGPISRY